VLINWHEERFSSEESTISNCEAAFGIEMKIEQELRESLRGFTPSTPVDRMIHQPIIAE
jgi:hypothetical protein